MSIVYKLSWTDGSHYYGKSIHNNIEGRYGSTLEDYLSDASNDDVRAKLNEFGLPSVEIIDQTEDWDQTDDLEEFLIRVYINNKNCLNKSLIFIPIKVYLDRGYEEELVLKVANDIKNTTMDFKEIGAKYGVPESGVSAWNNGRTKKELLESHGFSFPIRKPNITEDNIVLACADLLKNTDLTMKKIGAKHNITRETVSLWNNGRVNKELLESHGFSFPIRDVSEKNKRYEDVVLACADLLKNTDLTYKEIGAKHNIDKETVRNWSIGRVNKELLESHGFSSPIREVKVISEDVVLACADLLKNTDMTLKKIELKYNLKPSTVSQWNIGVCRKGLLESQGYTFPIRSKNSAIKTESVDSLKINA